MGKRQTNAVKRKTELCTHWVHFFERPNCIRGSYTIEMGASAVLGIKRTEYSKRIVTTLSQQLKHCIRTAYLFSEDQIGYALRSLLTWTHLGMERAEYGKRIVVTLSRQLQQNRLIVSPSMMIGGF